MHPSSLKAREVSGRPMVQFYWVTPKKRNGSVVNTVDQPESIDQLLRLVIIWSGVRWRSEWNQVVHLASRAVRSAGWSLERGRHRASACVGRAIERESTRFPPLNPTSRRPYRR